MLKIKDRIYKQISMKLKTLRKIFFTCLLTFSLSVYANPYNLPELGSSGANGMTIQRERMIGDYFMRMARGHLNIAEDPVLTEFLNSVGNRLVLNASDVRFPFEFFVVNNTSLNASAFLGGKVQVYTGLFHYADTEDEFASVIAHEISHVTQRHIARFIEEQTKTHSLTVAGMIGAVAMSLINPVVGMAALSTTLGANIQSKINFTRDNEYEADRIAIDLLYKSGYNPMGMSDLFRKLMNMQGNINPAFALLIDHPLSDIRTAEAENRARQYPRVKNSQNKDFMLAKARVDIRYMGYDLKDLKNRLDVNPDKINQIYRNYALALIAYEQKDFESARNYLKKLNLNENIFVIDLLTDIDIEDHKVSNAISRLKPLHQRRPNNQAVVVNLANAYLVANQGNKAIDILKPYQSKHPQDYLVSTLLTDAYKKANKRCLALQSGAYSFSLQSNYPRALGMYSEALNYCNGNEREIVRAKMAELSKQRSFDEEMTSNPTFNFK